MVEYVSYFEDSGALYALDTEGRKSEISEKFPMSEWDSPEAFRFAGVRGYAPMLALEISEEEQDRYFDDSSTIIEEKLDGTRALVHFFSSEGVDGKLTGYCRVFSRRVSKHTNFYVENSDLIPHIRDLDVPDLAGTVIDGELRIDGRPFKDVSSTLNCKWNKAVARQSELGFVILHAFDVLRYKGTDVRRCPLSYRKFLLHRVLTDGNSGLPKFQYIKEHPWYFCGQFMRRFGRPVGSWCCIPYEDVPEVLRTLDRSTFPAAYNDISQDMLSPRGYYEYIVSSGGEGVILKPSDGRYKCGKRQRDYLKVKKFLTRECIIMGFTEPTKEYSGKFVNNRWDYWVRQDGDTCERLDVETYRYLPADELIRRGLTPVTRFYYYRWVGNIRYGVLITDDFIATLPQGKKFHVEDLPKIGKVLEVGDCAGFSDDMKRSFSFSRIVTACRAARKNFPDDYSVGDVVEIAPWESESNKWLWDNSEPCDWVGKVVEIKANELFSDTGKMRHPRFLRLRPDKSPEECTWEHHIS